MGGLAKRDISYKFKQSSSKIKISLKQDVRHSQYVIGWYRMMNIFNNEIR